MRTQEEILQKIDEVKDIDFFGFISIDLVQFLDYENARKFLNEGTTEKEWVEVKKENTKESIINEMKDYLSFAREKAEGQRGLSAARSMDHYYAWIWLIGEEERFGDIRDYSNYGIPQLDEISSFLHEKQG